MARRKLQIDFWIRQYLWKRPRRPVKVLKNKVCEKLGKVLLYTAYWRELIEELKSSDQQN